MFHTKRDCFDHKTVSFSLAKKIPNDYPGLDVGVEGFEPPTLCL